MATRDTAHVQRITRQRIQPLVRCTFAGSLDARWEGDHHSCGELIPFRPQRPCPKCGQKQIRAHAPNPGPDSLVIDGPATIIDAETEEVVCVHWTGAGELATRLGGQLQKVHWHDPVNDKINNSGRLSGLRVEHRVFGFTPPAPMRRRYGCSRSTFNIEYPEAMQTISEFCILSEWVFRTFAPDVHERTGAAVRETIPNAWRMAGTLWTSGIINNTASLPYHRDSANVPHSWSSMLGVRKRMDGGFLHLADYDVYLAIPHGSISIFDGQSVIHGVTPMRPVGPNPYRYTCVTYAKSIMSRCSCDPADEARRTQLASTAAEDARIRPR